MEQISGIEVSVIDSETIEVSAIDPSGNQVSTIGYCDVSNDSELQEEISGCITELTQL